MLKRISLNIFIAIVSLFVLQPHDTMAVNDLSASEENSSDKLRWEVVMPTEDQIFPSYILALAEKNSIEVDKWGFPIPTEEAGRGLGRYGIVIKDLPAGTKNLKVKLSFKIDRLADLQTFEETIRKNEQNAAVFFPPIVWNLEELRRVNNSFSTNIKFAVSIDGKAEEIKNVVVRVKSVNEALFGRYVKQDNKAQKYLPSGWIFGAYVNEDHPWIDKLLKEAIDTGLVNSFAGYQGDREEDVYKQLFAIWNVLQRRGFRYSSITDTSNASNQYFSQYVRLFEDSINTSQANCVDGSVLWISILRKIGIKGYLILVPGHCFIVIDADGNKGNKLIGLETTMMGSVNLKQAAQDTELIQKLGANAVDKVSFNSFIAAIDSGTKTFSGAADKLTSLNSKVINPAYQFIDVEDVRQRRIYPISR